MRFPRPNKAGVTYTDPTAPRRPYVPRPCFCGCGQMGLQGEELVKHLEQLWAERQAQRDAEWAAKSPEERRAQTQRDIADLFPE